jgi:predicted GNAT family N-acyltransferase
VIKTTVVQFDDEHAREIKKIRNTVFTGEENIDEHADFDGQDLNAIHVLIEMDGQFVGTGRMLIDGHIGRLAVLRSARGRGLGKKIMYALIDQAKKQNINRVYLGAQKHAIGFYKKIGFSEYGDAYEEVGITHVHMEKLI